MIEEPKMSLLLNSQKTLLLIIASISINLAYGQTASRNPTPGKKPQQSATKKSTPFRELNLHISESDEELMKSTETDKTQSLLPSEMTLTTSSNMTLPNHNSNASPSEMNLPDLTSKAKLSVTDIYMLALNRDMQLKSSRKTIEISELHFLADKSLAWGPKVRLTASLGYGNQRMESSATPKGSNTDGFTTAGGFTINQPIFHLPEIIQARKSEYAIELQKLQFAADLQTFIRRTVVSYLEVLKNRESIKFKIDEINAAQRILNFLLEQEKVGLATKDDVAKARARVSTATSEKFTFEANLAIAKAAFSQFWNLDGSKLKNMKSKVQFTLPVPLDVEVWRQESETNNLAVQYNEGLIKLSVFDIEKSSKALYMPTVDLNAGCSTQSTSSSAPFGPSDLSNSGCSVTFNISALLFDGFYTQRKVRELNSTREKIEFDATLVKQNAGLTAISSFSNVVAGYNKIAQLKNSVRDGQTALDGAQEKYKFNGTTLIDVLTAVANLNQYKTSLIIEKINFIVNKVTLKQAVGNLSENDLKEIDTMLE